MNFKNATNLISTDLLVIGGGAAGARAAIEGAKYGLEVTLVSKGKLGRSGSSPISGGGISGAYREDVQSDINKVHYEIHLEDSEGLCDQSLARAIAEECVERVTDIKSYGVGFEDRWLQEGKTHFKVKDKLFPTHMRTVEGGYGLMWGLRKEALQRGIKLFERIMVTRLVKNKGKVIGAVGIKTDSGEIYIFASKATILAAGSATGLYPYTSAFRETTGDSFALAFNAGARLVDLEFLEFQVGAPFVSLGPAFEGLGGNYYNAKGEIIPRSESFRRYENTLVVYKELREGRGPIYADAREVDFSRWAETQPHLFELVKAGRYDRHKLRLVIQIHSVIGGIQINDRAETGVEGLYAAGEATGGVHGASRVRGEALAETQVFGQRAGMYASKYVLKSEHQEVLEEEVGKEKERFNALLNKKGGISPGVLKTQIQQIMEERVGVLREEKGLKETVAALKEMETFLSALSARNTRELIKALEVQNLHLSAQMIATAALKRRESRGSHQRTDYPERDDRKWLKHIAISRKPARPLSRYSRERAGGDGGMKASLVPVEITSL